MSIVGIGVDILETARLQAAVTRTPGLLDRCYTAAERAVCTTGDGHLRYDALTARWAAKEAVAKAFGTGIRGFGFADVEVLPDPLGKPEVSLHAGAAAVAARLGITHVHVALTTGREAVVANAVAEHSP